MKLDTVAVWNDLHKTPELGFQEFKTSAYIAAALEKMGYAVTRGIAGTGVLAVKKGTEPGPVMLLRADMAPLDLLPEPGAVKEAIELARRPVSEVMYSPVAAVAPDTALRRVAGVLLETGLPGLPVTDETGVLIGFISRTDILRAVAADPPLDLWSGPAPQA